MKILVGRNGKQTVKLISETTGDTVEAQYTLRSGKKVWRTNYEKQRLGYSPNVTGGTVVRWATGTSERMVGEPAVEYNRPEAILLASNKARARRVLVEAGIPTPETTTDRGKALLWLSSGETVIRRPKKHFGGRSFFVHSEPTDHIPIGDFYYQKFYQKKEEYRAHCAHGKVLVLQKKVMEDGEPDVSVAAPWNHTTGNFVFQTVPWSEYSIDVCKVALDATKEIGLDFSAVDIMVNRDSDIPVVVCELNTSPALADYSLGRYTKYFQWLGRSEERRDHWDYSEFTAGKSFAWKNYQLTEEESNGDE